MLLASDKDSLVWWDWVGRHVWSDPVDLSLVDALREHLVLTVVTVVVSLALAVPLGVLAHRRRRLETPVVLGLGTLYTIPSIALFAFLVPVTGLSRTTALIGLVTYSLVVLVRNVLAGLASVPEDVKEAATGMGFGPWRTLWKVELPLALPAILAGLRVATVSTIALVPVTALIGQGGFGQFIDEGLRDVTFRTPLVLGIGLSIALAVLADLLLIGVERFGLPWKRGRR